MQPYMDASDTLHFARVDFRNDTGVFGIKKLFSTTVMARLFVRQWPLSAAGLQPTEYGNESERL
jgi:hypothetical protein